MFDIYHKAISFSMKALSIVLCHLIVLECAVLCAQGPPAASAKICGMSLESPPRKISAADMQGVHASGSNWVAIIPYGYSRKGEPLVHFNADFQWWGESVEGTLELIQLAKAAGFSIVLKPQVWLMGGWIGDYDAGSEENWKRWEESYSLYILAFAKMAEAEEVDMFCIGTEYKIATAQRPAYWKGLIAAVRKVYTGEITYAANWNEYMDISFWGELDYIGIDAYFPLLHVDEPLIAELSAAWNPIKKDLKLLHEKYQKPVLLAEYGYRSVNGAAGNQWEQDGRPVNHNAQRKAYLALYDALWHEPWIAGGFAWKWHFKPDAGGPDNSQYTPQGKPALEVIKMVYQKTLR